MELPLTEAVHPSTADLDRLDTHELLHRINDEDRRAAWAVERELDTIATAVDEIAERVSRGGRIHWFGAGTSGRLALMDAAELPPTFSADPERFVAHIAGGYAAMRAAVEGAEDDEAAGRDEARRAGLHRGDVAIGVSASGGAPYVLGALSVAAQAGALTVGIANSPGAPLSRIVQLPIELLTGPEVVTGSTRMKAAAAQKIALHTLSTAVMVKLGKVYGNLMIDVQPTNRKLRDRAQRIVSMLTGASASRANTALEDAGFSVAVATVALSYGCSPEAARRMLDASQGGLRPLLENAPQRRSGSSA